MLNRFLIAVSLGIVTCSTCMSARAGRITISDAPETNVKVRPPARVPFELYLNSLIFLQARVNGSEPMWFVLDSASTFSFLDAGKAEALGIKAENRDSITGSGGGSIEIAFGKGASLDISGVKLTDQTFAITQWRNKYDRNVVGMIGAPFFKQFVVEIDYQAKNLTLHNPQTYTYTGKGSSLPLEFSEEIPAVRVGMTFRTGSSSAAKLDVDTGAGQTIILNTAFVESHKLLSSTEGMLKFEAGSLAGKVSYFTGRSKTVTLGGFALESVLTNFSGQGGMKVRAGIDGVIGNWLLKRFRVILDCSHRRMILEPSDLFPVATDFEMTGLSLVREGAQFKIDHVFRGSLAEGAGLHAGDVLVAIDNRSASQMNLIQLRQMFKQDGSKLALTIKRGAETLWVTLHMLEIR